MPLSTARFTLVNQRLFAKHRRRIPAWIGIGQLLHQCILLLDALRLHEGHELEENIHHTVWYLIGMSSLILI